MDRNFRMLRIATLAAALSLPAMVAAQAPPKPAEPIPPKSDRLDQKNGCGPDRGMVGQGAHDTKPPAPDGRNLSEKLAQSNGVLCPPSDVDPAIKAPTPEGGSMPVIPPPGTPGGDRSIQPK